MANEVGIRLSVSGEQRSVASLDTVEQSLARLNAGFIRLGTVGAALYAIPQAFDNTVGSAVRAADAVTVMSNQLKLATGNAKLAAQAYESLFDIAQRSRVSFTELGGTFASISRAGEALGISQSRLLGVTEAISNAVTVSGGSAESAKAALIQLSQGLSSGVLRGDELNSVMEQTPRLAKALADGLGVTTGQLRDLGKEGKITSDAVIRALESQAKVLTGEVKNSVTTVGQALTQIQNSATKLVGDFDTVTGSSSALATGLSSVAKSADTLGGVIRANADAINTTIGVLAGTATAAGIGFVASSMASLAKSVGGVTGALVLLRTTVASLNPWTLALLGGGAVMGAIVAQHDEFAKTKQGIEEKIKYLERLSSVDRKSLESAGVDPDTNKFFLKALDERSTKIATLQKELERYAQAEREALAPEGSVPSGDVSLARELARAAALKKGQKHELTDFEKASARGKKLYGDLIAQESGLAPDFEEKWNDLGAARKSAAITTQQLVEAQRELLSQQPFAKDQLKEQAELTKALVKNYEEEVKAHQDRIRELDKSAAGEVARVQSLQDEETATALATANNISLAVAIEQVGLARVQETYAKEAAANADGQTLVALQKEIQARESIIKSIGAKDGRTASEAAAKKTAEEWKRTADKIETGITEALMRGWENGKTFAENFRDTVVNIFKTLVLQPVISAIVNPVAQGLTGLVLSGSAAASDGLSGASAINAASGANTLASMGGWITNFGSSATEALYKAGEKVYSMGFESLGKSMMGNINEAGGFTAMADKLQAVGNGLGYLNATMLAAGGQWGAAVGAGIGTYFGGPIGSVIGQAIGGWVDNAFGGGHEYTTGTGIKGTFSSGGFAGSNYQSWHNNGSSGVFGIGGSGSSSGTNYSALSSDTQTSLSMGFAAVQLQAAAMATSLGLDAKAIASYTQDISVALGSDAAANKKAIDDLFASIADNVSLAVAPSIADLAKSGEAASVTLARLSSSILTSNVWLTMLKEKLFDVSLAGGDAASKLADAFGGLDKLTSASQAFYDGYFTNSEKVANSQKQMTDALAAYGLALPESKQALRDLAGTLDLNTDAGRATYATLLKLAPTFASTIDLMASTAKDAAAVLLKSFTGSDFDKTEIQFGKLADALKKVDAATFTETIFQAFESLANRIAGVVDSIKTERTAVSAAALQITNPAVMTKDAIQSAISGIVTSLPDSGNLALAGASMQRANEIVSAGESDKHLADYLVKVRQSIESEVKTVLENTASIPELKSFYEYRLADAKNSLANAQAAADSSGQLLDQAKIRQAAAVAAANKAILDYQNALQGFAIDAAKSVSKLTDLRAETVKYYEAQKALAELMQTSASNLLKSVAGYKVAQLQPDQQAARLQYQFASDYSMALSSQADGATLTSYADKLDGELGPLIEALKSNGQDNLISNYLAQAENIAALLKDTAPKTYTQDSLELLGSIDTALAALDDSSKSAGAYIAAAVAAGSERTAAGLHAVIAALTGGSIPAFATGAAFGGGLVKRPSLFSMGRMGEAGPEAIMPLANINGSLGVRVAGGGSEMIDELRGLRAELANLHVEMGNLRIEARATATNTNRTAKLWERVTRDGEAVQTVAAV